MNNTKDIKTNNETLDWARKYVSKGFSVIPIEPRGKKPAISSWKEFQDRKPTDEELAKWFGGSGQNNIGIVTGKMSGIAVVDLDSEKAMDYWRSINAPETPVVKTGKEHGYHKYYAYPKDCYVRNFQKRDDLPDIDLRGDGGYVVAPPSIHESGSRYRWLPGYDLDQPLAPLPEIILKQGSEDKAPLKELYQGVSQGERNNSLARLVGSWANDGLSNDECLEIAHLWNDKNNPPVPKKEVESTVRSIFNRHQDELSNCPNCPTHIAGHLDNRNPQRDDPHGITFRPEEVLVTGSVLMKLEDTKVEWLVDKIIPKQSITLLHGRGGIGKTWLALMLADAVSKGRRFMELEVIKCPAVYIDYENSYPVMVERVKRLEASDVQFWHSSAEPPPPKLDSHDWAWFKQLPKGLLIIDTLRASQLRDENDSKEMALILNRLKELREIGQTILLLHHTPKGNERTYKGSTAILDLADHVLSLHKVKKSSFEEADDDDEDCLYYFGTKVKTRYEPSHIYLEFDKEKGFVVARDPDMDDIEVMYEILKGRGPLNQSKIFDLIKTELGINSKGRVVKLLRKGEGKYWTAKKDGRATIYCPICPIQGVDNRTDEKDAKPDLQLVKSPPPPDGSMPPAEQEGEDDYQIIDDTEGDPLEEV